MKFIPNILSFIRILLIPLFVWLMGVNVAAAGVVLAVSGLTDTLDGYLARKYNWITQLGKVLDPAADKMTQVTVCVVLAMRLRAYLPFFVVLFAKDLIMLVLGGYLIRKGIKIDGAKWFGKVVTILFYLIMTAIVLFPSMSHTLITVLLTVVTVCAVLAAVMYVPEFISYLRQRGKPKR